LLSSFVDQLLMCIFLTTFAVPIEPYEGKKHIAVIGAGASGLTAIKELTAMGHKVGLTRGETGCFNL